MSVVSAPASPDQSPMRDQQTLRGVRARTRRQAGSGAGTRVARSLGSVVISVGVTLVLWVGFLRIFHIDHTVAKNPLDVWRYVFTDHAAATHRHVLLANLDITLRDAALGYGAGMIGGTLLASVFMLRRSVEQTFMPVALVLRSVPLIAMVPLITLIFGRDVLAVTVIGGIVCFFPTLINVAYGLRSTPKSTTDLMESYGASKLTTLRKVLLPSAVPAFFASARINVPGALIGALLAEWVATGKGSGDEMITVVNTFDYAELWSAVALVTTVSILLYSIVSVAEAGVLSRYVPDSAGRRR